MPCKNYEELWEWWIWQKIRQKLACILEADESTWRTLNLQNHEDHIAGKGENSLQHYNLVHKFYSYASSYEDSGSESSSGQGMGKNWRKFRRGTWPKSKVRKTWSMKQGPRALTVHFASLMDICHLKKSWIGGKAPKVQRSSCAPRWYCKT